MSKLIWQKKSWMASYNIGGNVNDTNDINTN